MVPKRKRLHDALLNRGYSKQFAETVAYADKPKLYEPPPDPVKVLVIMEPENQKDNSLLWWLLAYHRSAS